MEEKTQIGAPPDRVFGLLIEPRSWSQWWRDARFARSADFKPLREGSRFEMTLEFGRLRSTLKPTVTLCADGKALAWKADWLALPVRQEYYLQANERGCQVRARTLFPGALQKPLAWLRIDRIWQQMIQRQLRSLRQTAERL